MAIQLNALKRLLGQNNPDGSPDADSTMQLWSLRRQATEARDARNAQRDWTKPWTFEREDPNMGTMSILSQALDNKSDEAALFGLKHRLRGRMPGVQ